MSNARAPVIAIDGPSASGKGTVAQRVAQALGFHFLDSGALYRLVGLSALKRGAALEDARALADIARDLDVSFEGEAIVMNRRDVSTDIRDQRVGEAASRVAALPSVRDALLERQRAFRKSPGLVADGRDMASVVFPDAELKIFLTAAAEERAQRRYKQLIDKGLSASMSALLQEIRERDARDSGRAAAPLQKCADAVELDTTSLSIDDSVAKVLTLYKERGIQVP